MEWYTIVLLLIVLVTIVIMLISIKNIVLPAIWSYVQLLFLQNKRTTGGGPDAKQTEFKVHKMAGSGSKTILLIPGLGNGKESYNWDMSTEEQQTKTGIIGNTTSLQKQLTDLGYTTISFDPPGYGENFDFPVPETLDEYLELLNGISPDINLVIGHSIGARVAQLFGNKYNKHYIMIDPSPEYLLESINYTKHLSDPNKKYMNTYKIIKLIKDNIDRIKTEKLNPLFIVYSIDNEDIGRVEKEKYFAELPAEKIKFINATHWVHVTKQKEILDKMKDLKNLSAKQ